MLPSPLLGLRAVPATAAIALLLVTGSNPPAVALRAPEPLPSAPANSPSLVLPPAKHPTTKKARPRKAGAVVTKTTRYVAVIGGWQGAIDRCRGPVAFKSVVPGVPWIMAEHVHCGGRWALSVRRGTTLRVNNGALAGTWKANGRSKVVRQGSSTSVTRGLGNLVVQTCIPGTRLLKLVGFNRA